jgi:hypothetical protein
MHPEYPCQRCQKVVPEDRRYRKSKYCSNTCRQEGLMERYREMNKRQVYLSPSTVGAIAELDVAADLMRRGYDVFRALSPACSCDLAVLKDGALLRIEVRSGYRDLKGKARCGVKSKDEGRYDVLAIYLAGETAIVYEPEMP